MGRSLVKKKKVDGWFAVSPRIEAIHQTLTGSSSIEVVPRLSGDGIMFGLLLVELKFFRL